MTELSIVECLHAALYRLQHCDISAPRLEAEVLLAHTLGCQRTYLHAYSERKITDEQAATYEKSITRRCAGEPLAYITGTREFCGLDFMVRPGVLIPRQETEHLVELLVEHKPKHFADIGTGSGCIAISALVQLPSSKCIAVDISSDALEIARENASALGVTDRIEFRQGDLCAPICGEQFDAIVSNPPYIDHKDADGILDEVKKWEPAGALFAEDSGLACYPKLAAQAEKLLHAGGLFAVEVGFGQAQSVVNIISSGAYEAPHIICDYAGIERVVWSIKKR